MIRLRFFTSLFLTSLFIISCSKDTTSCTKQIWYKDADGDGFGDISQTQNSCTQPNGYVSDSSDFNDNDANSYPNAVEICDGIDNDNDGQIDGLNSANCGASEVCENGACIAAITYYFDNDGDGFGDPSNSVLGGSTAPTGYVLDNTDCEDTDPNTYPNAPEILADGIDNNCNGYTDEILCTVDSDCPNAQPTCTDQGNGLWICQ